jgi:hypothetical protein
MLLIDLGKGSKSPRKLDGYWLDWGHNMLIVDTYLNSNFVCQSKE